MDGHRPKQIGFICQPSLSLVKEYIAFIDKHIADIESPPKPC